MSGLHSAGESHALADAGSKAHQAAMQHEAPQHVVVSDEQHRGPSGIQASLHPKVLCTAERSDDVS